MSTENNKSEAKRRFNEKLRRKPKQVVVNEEANSTKLSEAVLNRTF
jgi:hypothetical protein